MKEHGWTEMCISGKEDLTGKEIKGIEVGK